MKRFPRSWFISRVTCLMHFPRSINDDIKILKNNEIKQNIWIKNIYDKKTFYWRVKRSVTQFLFGVVVLVLKNVSPEKLFFHFKQLIPEFFHSSGEFLLNSQSLPLGCKQDKTKVMDVELPAWAKGGTKLMNNLALIICTCILFSKHVLVIKKISTRNKISWLINKFSALVVREIYRRR